MLQRYQLNRYAHAIYVNYVKGWNKKTTTLAETDLTNDISPVLIKTIIHSAENVLT